MKIINTIAEMQAEGLNILRSSMIHGLVPTMGALHDGHLSLIEAAKEECDIVTVSIFLNPTQFDNESDLENYPKTFEDDVEKAVAAGADIIFAPRADEMYSSKRDTVVMVDKLANHLCGLSRGRGHFIGVCTVVTKLFNITRTEYAYFGQKDAQQALIIQRMIIDLNIPVKMKICPIVREESGLALSSRNKRIQPGQTEQALSLYNALKLGEKLIAEGERNASTIINRMVESIIETGDIEVDYLDIVSPETLDDVEEIEDLVLIAGAIKLDNDLRLIDNILAAPEE